MTAVKLQTSAIFQLVESKDLHQIWAVKYTGRNEAEKIYRVLVFKLSKVDRLVTNAKNYKKLISRSGFVSQIMFSKKLVAVQKI